jgi:multicomponent Na+:H+ antiporter subunit E
MSESPGILVPVSDTDTMDRTVRHVLKEVDEGDEVHFVVATDRGGYGAATSEEAEGLLNKVEVWVSEADASADAEFEEVETDGYLFSPSDHAALFVEYCEENGIEKVVLDPGYRVSATSPTLFPLGASLRGYDLEVERADVERRRRRTRVLTRGGAARFATVFLLSYGFYLAVGSLGTFDLVTGAFAALLVSAVLYRVSFESTPVAVRVPMVTARLFVYTPYLLWEILKANVQIAYVVLHPDLPIDPSVEEVESMVWGGLPVTTLANSITLTPGTLTVDVEGRTLSVHTLTRSAREGLLDGALERGVRFVFYGRRAIDYPTPRERGEEKTGEEG